MGHSHSHLKYVRNYFWKDVFTLTPVAHMRGTCHGHAIWVSSSSPLTTEIDSGILIIFRAIAKDMMLIRISVTIRISTTVLAWLSFRSGKKFALSVGARREIAFPRNSRECQWLDAELCTKDMGAQTFSFQSTSLVIPCWQEAHSWQDCGLEMASPMVVLSKD